MSKLNEVHAAAIVLIASLLAAAIIFYLGAKAHADALPYYVIVDVRLDIGESEPPPEDNFEKRHIPPSPPAPAYVLITSFSYIEAPPFADYTACQTFAHTNKTFWKRLKMLYEFETRAHGPSVSLDTHCGARID